MASEVNIVISATDKASGVLTKIAGGVLNIAKIAAKAAVGGIAAFGTVALKTSISVEDAFAGITKTTDGLVDKLGNLTTAGEEVKQQFRDLAFQIPLTLEELMNIGELAGALGVPKEALADFTKTIAALEVSTNLSGEAAADALARIQNIYQISAADMGENTSRLGSAIVALGNNFATTESEITNFTERIAGAGRIAGLKQSDILAISAAMASVGVEAEAGGTAVQKVLLEMAQAVVKGGEDLTRFAEASGVTAKEFSDTWKKDPILAFESFVQNLGDSGDGAMKILSDLGLEDQRLIRAFLSLSNAGDLLSKTIDLSSTAFEENTALTTEAGKRYETLQSQIAILKNSFRDVALTVGDLLAPSFEDALNKVTAFLQGLDEETIVDFAEKIKGISLADVANWASDFWVNTTAALKEKADDIDWAAISDAILDGLNSIDWETQGANFAEGARNLVSGISTALSDAFREIKWGELFQSLGKAEVDFLTGMGLPSPEDVAATVTGIRNTLVTGLTNIKTVVQALFRALVEEGKKMGANLVGSIASGITGAMSAIIAAVRRIITAIQNMLSNANFSVPIGVSGSSGGSSGGTGGTFMLPKPKTPLKPPPKFAEGGIARGPESGYPAILHGTEAVLPLDKAGSFGGVTVNVNISSFMSLADQSAAEMKLVPIIERAIRSARGVV